MAETKVKPITALRLEKKLEGTRSEELAYLIQELYRRDKNVQYILSSHFGDEEYQMHLQQEYINRLKKYMVPKTGTFIIHGEEIHKAIDCVKEYDSVCFPKDKNYEQYLRAEVKLEFVKLGVKLMNDYAVVPSILPTHIRNYFDFICRFVRIESIPSKKKSNQYAAAFYQANSSLIDEIVDEAMMTVLGDELSEKWYSCKPVNTEPVTINLK